MSKHQIEILFIAGFGSSLLFGTFIGSIADKLWVLGKCFAETTETSVERDWNPNYELAYIDFKFFSGRRNNCLMYAILYGGACITKHFGNMPVLMIGRFLGGVATSILYSAFESWLIFEHNTVSLERFNSWISPKTNRQLIKIQKIKWEVFPIPTSSFWSVTGVHFLWIHFYWIRVISRVPCFVSFPHEPE